MLTLVDRAASPALFATNFFGAQLVELWHDILHRIPVVNSIYSSVKQVSDTLFSSSGQAFRKAVLVQWPRAGHVDHRVPHRHARRRASPSTCRRDYVERLRADHAEPDRRLFRHRAAQGRDRARHERRRGAEVHHLDGRASRRLEPRDRCEPTTAAARAPALLEPDRDAVRLGAPPPRPRRRDLHRPARPRRPRAGGVRPGPRRTRSRSPSACATSSCLQGDRQGARAPGGHRQPGPARAARSRCWRTSSRS